MSTGHLHLDGFDSPSSEYQYHKKAPTMIGGGFLMVEMRGIEPLSESNLERLSPGAVCYLHSLTLPGTNTLQSLVAS